MQHQLENEQEEWQVELKRRDDEVKIAKRKFQEFQKNHIGCEKEKKDLLERATKAEKERQKLNEKYIKLSQRLKETGPNHAGNTT